MAEPLLAVADRHARLRWLGIVLFWTAAVVFVATTGAVVTGRAPIPRALVPFVAMGLSLGTFGANNDTFLHALADLARKKAVPARHQAEWDHERHVRAARLKTVHAAPKVGLVLPLVAAGLVAWAGYRAAQAWGWV